MTSASSLILPPFGSLYSLVARLRLAAYQRGIFPTSKLPKPVVSVGNLTTGGTGKTPLVEWVCRQLAGDGKNVCVLTRGYRRAHPQTQIVVSNGHEILSTVTESGDEPFLLASHLVGMTAVVCNADRQAAGQWAVENLGSDVFVLDDGFQHLRLARNYNIVTIDATNPWGGGNLLPYGRLREPISSLARADCVVLTRIDQIDDPSALIESVESLVGGAPVFSSRMTTSGLRLIDGQEIDSGLPLEQPVGAFCGVGNPASFFNHLRSQGFQLAFTRTFADHHSYSQSDLDTLAVEARDRGASSLITTAKDATKVSSLTSPLPCYVLEIRIEIENEERLAELIKEAISQSSV